MEVKSVGAFPVILVKLETPFPTTLNKVEFLSNMGRKECFFGQNIAGGVGGGGGDDRMNLTPIKKLSLGAEPYVTITWNGFFTKVDLLQVDNVSAEVARRANRKRALRQSQVLLSSIVGSITSRCSGKRARASRGGTKSRVTRAVEIEPNKGLR